MTKQTKQQIEDEYDKITDLAYAEYEKITVPALAEKERKLAELEDMTNQTKQTVEDELQRLSNMVSEIWRLRKEPEDINRINSDLLDLNKRILEIKVLYRTEILKAKEDRDKEILEFAETVAYCVEVGDERTVVASSDLIDFLIK